MVTWPHNVNCGGRCGERCEGVHGVNEEVCCGVGGELWEEVQGGCGGGVGKWFGV